MSILLFFAMAVAIIVVPVKLAANYVQAGRTGFLACLFAVIVVSVLQKGLETFISNQAVLFVVVLAIAPAIFMIILDTTYKKGLIISAVQVVLVIVLSLILVAMFPGEVTVEAS